jgi:hypothetical protein
MDGYDKQWDDGHTTLARFCTCGHAMILGSADGHEVAIFEENWSATHTGSGHARVSFDQWLKKCLSRVLAKAA